MLADALEQVELADRWTWGSTTSGRSSTTSSRSTRTRVPRRSSWPRPVSGPATSGSATGSCRSLRGQSPRAGGGAGRHPRPDLRGPGRVRDRRGKLADRARRVRRRAGGQAGAVGGIAGRDHPDVRRGAVRRLRRALDLDAASERDPKAEAATAPADVGGVQPSPDDPDRRRAGAGRARVLVRRARGRQGVGGFLLRDHLIGPLHPGGIQRSTPTSPSSCR